MTDLIKINAKTPTVTYNIEIAAGATVSELKDKLLTQVPNATKPQLCVIYTGKILKDEEKLDQLKIGDGYTVHLVVRSGASRPAAAATPSAPAQPAQAAQAPSTTTPTPNPFGAFGGAMPQASDMMNNPEMMRQMMDNPMIQSMLSNPEFMRTILSSNPQFQQLIERNPEVGHMLNDPSIMRQTMEMMRNPNMFQEMMRNQDLAIRNLQGIPGGEAALERLYNDVQEPLMSSTAGLGGNPFASLRSDGQANAERSDRAGHENNEALPNPWGPPPASNTQNSDSQIPAAGLGGLGGMLNSPGMSSLMQQMMSNPEISQSLFNPEMMRTMRETMRSNPQLMDSLIGASPTGQANPQLANMMRQRLPEMLEMMGNPDFVQAMQNPRVADAFRQIQQGFEVLRTEAPQLIGMMGSFGGAGAGGFGSAPRADQVPSNGEPNADRMDFIARLLGNVGLNNPAAPVANPEEQYAAQLEQLQSMGFSNRAANIAALSAVFGDLNAAVERLLNSPR